MRRIVRLLIVLSVVSCMSCPGLVISARAAGPWQAQVVTTETKQPLEGVVVLAWWTRHVRSFGGPSEEYRDSQEVLTDKDGRFAIAPRWFFSLNPLVFFRGPFFVIFKSGYGEDRWPGYDESPKWPEAKRKALAMYANLLQLEGIVLEMAALQDVERRRKHLQKVEIHALAVPVDKRQLLQEAMEAERHALGYRSHIHPK